MSELKEKGKLEHCILVYENQIDCTSPFKDFKDDHLAAIYAECGRILCERLLIKEVDKRVDTAEGEE